MERKLQQLRQNIIAMLVCFISILVLLLFYILLENGDVSWRSWIFKLCDGCAVVGFGITAACLRLIAEIKENVHLKK